MISGCAVAGDVGDHRRAEEVEALALGREAGQGRRSEASYTRM